jgi:hypothetical protein
MEELPMEMIAGDGELSTFPVQFSTRHHDDNI